MQERIWQKLSKNKINRAAKVMTNNNKITYEIGITINDKWVDAIFNKEETFRNGAKR